MPLFPAPNVANRKQNENSPIVFVTMKVVQSLKPPITAVLAVEDPVQTAIKERK